jgi:UDP-N-acetylglucosamine 1-carboxyvinyltransferase
MSQYIIKGGTPLTGEVSIGGAKNAALGIIAAAIMADDSVTIENIPDVRDINVLLDALTELGVRVQRINRHTVKINATKINSFRADSEAIRKIRGSYYLIGALLGKYHHAEVALPGGCSIGSRPIDQHEKGFQALGATTEKKHGLVFADAEKLTGNHIYLDISSVGATINIMLASVLATGQTVIENPAKEPHVVDVASFLNSMGANIKGAGTDVIRIKGVEKLHGTTYSIIPDQIEAGTFMMAAAITHGDIVLKNVIPKHLEVISAKLMEMGAEIEESGDSLRVRAGKELSGVNVKTFPYPGFPTDMQPQTTTVLATCTGTSVVTESVFESRFKYVDELSRMGAEIMIEGNTAVIKGPKSLTGATVSAPDLRAGAALVLAGLAAEGYTVVEQIEYIERGYEDFEKKMMELGAVMAKIEQGNERAIKKFKLKTA